MQVLLAPQNGDLVQFLGTNNGFLFGSSIAMAME